MKNKIICGIYKILNIKNGKFYIGSSTNIGVRLMKHKNELRKNIHYNTYLQRSFNKYGEKFFVFNIIETLSNKTTKKELRCREQYWLDRLHPYDKKIGYNISHTANGGGPTKHIGCKIKGCDRNHYSKGYCEKHYRRRQDNGSTSTLKLGHLPPIKNRTCKVKGCANKHQARKYCIKHYRRFIKYGKVADSCLIRKKYHKLNKCKVKSCKEKSKNCNYCSKHYSRFIKYGSASKSCLSRNPPKT